MNFVENSLTVFKIQLSIGFYLNSVEFITTFFSYKYHRSTVNPMVKGVYPFDKSTVSAPENRNRIAFPTIYQKSERHLFCRARSFAYSLETICSKPKVMKFGFGLHRRQCINNECGQVIDSSVFFQIYFRAKY